jgi:hypothetical protein
MLAIKPAFFCIVRCSKDLQGLIYVFTDSPNLALGKILLKTTETERNSSLAVDGLLSTCAVLNPPASANGWFVDLGELRKVGQVCLCIDLTDTS